jgi:hypothetical protein
MSDLRTPIWESLLDAEMNVKYWGCLARRLIARERALKIILAITTCSGVVSLSIWRNFPNVLGVVSAVLACGLPILNYSERIEKMSNLRGSWSQLTMEYERIWQNVGTAQSNCENEFRLLKDREVGLNVIETGLPNDRKLVQRCQQEVRRARGL